MKRKISFLLLALLCICAMAVLTSCLNGLSLPDFNDATNGSLENGAEGNEGSEPEPDPAPQTYKIKYVYKIAMPGSLKTESKTVIRQEIPVGLGFSEEQLRQKDDYLYNGYELRYFSDEDCVTPFDFDIIPTSDITVFCGRANYSKAGKNITWRVDTRTEKNVQGEDEQIYSLVFEGDGDMYEFYLRSDVPWIFNGVDYTEYESLISEVIIPEGITSVAGHAFSGFTNIGAVVLPSTIKYIGQYAFNDSTIYDINFPEKLETIGVGAFKNCRRLTRLDFNAGLKEIKDSAFFRCKAVETVVLTDSIMTLGTSAFQECTALSSAFYIGTEEQYNNITSRIDNAWVQELANTYFLSHSKPTAPGPYWYYDEDGKISQWYYTIWYLKDKTAKAPFARDYVDVDAGTNSSNVEFFKTVRYHGYKFDSWNLVTGKDPDGNPLYSSSKYTVTSGVKLTADIKLAGNRGYLCGDNVRWRMNSSGVLTIYKYNPTVDDGAMWDFEMVNDSPWDGQSIKKIVISEGITYIGRYVFSGIYNDSSKYANFTYIDIPKCVEEINVNAFSGCNDLLNIYYEGTELELYGDEENGIKPLIKGLARLEGLIDARVYANVNGMTLSELGEGAYWCNISGQNGTQRVAWVYKNGELLVGGGDSSRQMVHYNQHSDTPWYSYRDKITKIVINSNITEIGHYSFTGMESVKDITVPRGLLKTSSSAFLGTGYYNTEYSKGAVYLYCIPIIEELTGVEIKYKHLLRVNPEMAGEIFIITEQTLSIAEAAFDGCTSIKSLVMTKDISLSGIYANAFSGLTGLEAFYYEALEESFLNEDGSFKHENLQMEEGQLLENVNVYFYTKIKPSKDDLNKEIYWHWNDSKTAPVIWTKEN